MSDTARKLDKARDAVVNRAMYLGYAERAHGGRLTTSESADLDDANDTLDEALADYVTAYEAHATAGLS